MRVDKRAIALATEASGPTLHRTMERYVDRLRGGRPVKATPLDEWVKHGTNGHFVAKRWKEADEQLDPETTMNLRKAADRFMGRAYDLQFGWSDETIYCSELVWKMYAEALNIELCKPTPMRDHALGSAVVQRTIKERYGSTPPLDELMIGPGALFDCPLLVTVLEK